MDEPLPAEPPARTTTRLTNEERWRAVLERDGCFDGKFVYAVTSTRIYCNPSCPARRPGRERVRFFNLPEEAEAAGFRACKRCRPGSTEPSVTERMVEEAQSYIVQHLDGPLTLERLAEAVGLSPTHLHRSFTNSVGLTPKEFQDAQRMERFKEEVKRGRTVSRATFEAGFGSSRALYDKAEQALGMTPGTYRRGGQGSTIDFCSSGTPVGVLLVAATAASVCFVALGDSEAEVEELLRCEYPKARIRLDGARLSPWIDAVVEELRGASPGTDVPIELEGTEFQKCVWRAIRSIPRGETRSYGEVARSLGRPEAARAVASACGANRIALLVPCHRVVRADGEPGGYRWGRERKERLLRMESAPGPGR